jgi:hypothetical protein
VLYWPLLDMNWSTLSVKVGGEIARINSRLNEQAGEI